MPTPPNDSRRTTAATGPGAPGSRKPDTIVATGTDDQDQPWGILAAVLVIAAYVAWFYSADHRRRVLLGFLLVPDEMVNTWVEGDWSRFGILDHVPVVLGAALICGVAALTGWLTLSLGRRFEWLTRGERWLLSVLVGLNIWSLLALTLGLMGQLRNRGLFLAIALAVCLVAGVRGALWRLRLPRGDERYPPSNAEDTDQESADRRWFSRLPRWLAVPFGLFIVWGATLPATHFDVREYHLQVPKEWYQQGRVSFLPHNVYGNMPQGAEMHAVLGMLLYSGTDDWWWGALVGKTVMSSFAIWGALGVYFLGRRTAGTAAGAWGAFAYLATPWIAHVSMTGLIDGVVAAYVVGAVLAVYPVLTARQESRANTAGAELSGGTPNRVAAAALGGFLAGSAVACKYPALLFLAVPLGGLLIWMTSPRFDWRVAATYATALTLACGLWFGKNAAFTGNPTYPLLYKLFGGVSWNSEKDARWTKAHGPPIDPQGRRFTVAQMRDSLRVLIIASDHHGPWLLPLAAIGAATVGARSLQGRFRRGTARRDSQRSQAVEQPVGQTTRGEQRIQLIVIGGLIAFSITTWWLLTHRVDRFLVPIVPLIAVLAGWGAAWDGGPRWRRAASILALFCALATFVQVSSILGADNRVLIALRDLRLDLPRDLEHSLSRMNPGHHWLNQHVAPGDRVLMVGEAQVFDLEMPIFYNTCFDDCVLETLLKGKTTDERRRVLSDNRITYVFVSWYELQRYRQPGNYGYSDYPTRELFHQEFVAQQQLLRPIAPSNPEASFEIFQVVPAGGEKSP